MWTVRKMKRSKSAPAPSPLKAQLMEAWNKGYMKGFDIGAQEQREKDIESTVTMLEGLETIPGIGEKLAWKVREHIMKNFGSHS